MPYERPLIGPVKIFGSCTENTLLQKYSSRAT